MPETKIGSAIAGVDKHTDYSVDTQQTDGAFDYLYHLSRLTLELLTQPFLQGS